MHFICRKELCLFIQDFLCELRQDESGLMDFGIVVTAELGFLLRCPSTERFAQVGVGVLGAHDVTNLSARVSGNASVGVFNLRVEVLAEVLDLLDQGQVEPHAFALGAEHTVLGQSVLQELEEFGTEQRFSRTWIALSCV